MPTRLPTGYVPRPRDKRTIREMSRTNALIPVLLALGDHLAIVVLGICGFAAWTHLPSWLAVLVTGMVYVGQARSFRGLENLVHDGSHYNWARSRRNLNDRLTNLLAAWPVFSSVEEYRVGHLRHHTGFGGSRDPDYARYRELAVESLKRDRWTSFIAGVASRLGCYAAGWWLATGMKPHVLLRGLAWHLTAVCLASYVLPYERAVAGWLVFWAVPFALVLPVLRFVAEVAKHDYEQGTVFESTISNIGPLHRALIHPHGDGFHLLHHLYPAVPQYRLARLHRLLLREDPLGYGPARIRTRVLENP